MVYQIYNKDSVCKVEFCAEPAKSKGYCLPHYKVWYRTGDPLTDNRKPANIGPCVVDGCERPSWSKGLCGLHYRRLKEKGEFVAVGRVKREKGEGSVRADGYLTHRRNGKAILDHREVVERILGKPLPIGSVVHHLNGDRLDNRPCNLVVCPDQSYHALLHKRQRNSGYTGPISPRNNGKPAINLASLTIESLFRP